MATDPVASFQRDGSVPIVKTEEDPCPSARNHFLFEVLSAIRDADGHIKFTGIFLPTDSYMILGMPVPLHVGDPLSADWV